MQASCQSGMGVQIIDIINIFLRDAVQFAVVGESLGQFRQKMAETRTRNGCLSSGYARRWPAPGSFRGEKHVASNAWLL